MNSKNLSNSEACVPVSSQCVIWQGPNLECINVSRGDTIDDAVYKLANLLCANTDDLFDPLFLDWDGLEDVFHDPPDTMMSSFQALIDKTVRTAEVLAEYGISIFPGFGDYTYPAELIYTNQDGDEVRNEAPPEYTRHLAELIRDNIQSIYANTTNVSSLQIRMNSVEALNVENGVLMPMVQPNLPALGGGTVPINLAYMGLERAFIETSDILGGPASMISAIGQQCEKLAAQSTLTSTGSLMSMIPGWELNPKTVSETISNMWLTICDMREQITYLNGISGATCSDFVLDFAYTMSSDRKSVTFHLFGNTVIPEGFSAGCSDANAKIVITDGQVTEDFVFNFGDAVLNTSGITYDLDYSGFNQERNITFDLVACVKAGNIVCNKSKMYTDVYGTSGCIAEPVTFGAVQSENGNSNAIRVDIAVPNYPETAILEGYTYIIYDYYNNLVTSHTSSEIQFIYDAFPASGGLYKVHVIANYRCGDSSPYVENFRVEPCVTATLSTDYLYDGVPETLPGEREEGQCTSMFINDVEILEDTNNITTSCSGLVTIKVYLSTYEQPNTYAKLFVNNTEVKHLDNATRSFIHSFTAIPNENPDVQYRIFAAGGSGNPTPCYSYLVSNDYNAEQGDTSEWAYTSCSGTAMSVTVQGGYSTTICAQEQSVTFVSGYANSTAVEQSECD